MIAGSLPKRTAGSEGQNREQGEGRAAHGSEWADHVDDLLPIAGLLYV